VNFLNGLKIKAKLALLLSVSAAALLATLMLGAFFLHHKMVDDREQQAQRLTQVAVSIVASWHARIASEGLSPQAAQEGARATLRAMRYGAENYYFIQRYDGLVVLNPNRPELEGRNRWDVLDQDGVARVRVQIEAAQRGGDFVRYRFPHNGSTEFVHKLSYIAGFEPWQWAIGTGVYVDDIETEFRRSLLKLAGLAGLIFGAALVFAYFINHNLSVSLGWLKDKMERLADGDLTVEIGEAERADEIGDMAKAMRVFKQNAQAAQLLQAEREKRRELEFAMNHADRVDSLGRLASGIAHDLNNALVPVLAMTKSVMLKQAKGSRDYANLDLALMGAQRARELVQQILAFGRKQSIEYRDFDLAQVVNDGIRMLRAVLPSTIRLEAVVDPVPSIHGDPGQINQVLVNLVVNSSHAIGEEPGTIKVAVSGAGPDQVRLAVIDTGCGMDEQTAARLFEPFFTTKEVGKGTGLGLSVVRGIIASHGGTIAVKSAPGHGTEMEIVLPVAGRARAEPAQAEVA
jgi:signal transduction histidine kinase